MRRAAQVLIPLQDAPLGPQLNADRIIETVHALHSRIEERFPGSGLGRLSAELLGIARATDEQLRRVSRPNLPLRIAIGVLLLVAGVMLVGVLTRVELRSGALTLPELLQATEAAVNDVILFGAALYFLVSLEARIKRGRALRFLRELRAIAHIVDMHQLTKDPAVMVGAGRSTASSPRRALSQYDLARYLDYCTEMLALTSKLAALYAQNFDDPVVLGAVDEVETLTTGLAAKIWQKIVILSGTSSVL